MVTIYSSLPSGLQTNVFDDESFNGVPENSWIHIQNANQDILEKVSKFTGLSMDYLISALDEEENAHIESDDEEDITYIVLDTPYLIDEEKGVYATAPFFIAYNKKYFVTIANHEFNLISELMKKVKKIEPHKHVRLSTNLLYRLMTLFIYSLKKIDSKMKSIEAKLEANTKNKELYELMEINKTLVFFSTALNANRAVLLKLFKLDYYKKFEDDFDLMEDARIEMNQAIEMCSTYRDILKGALDAYSSIISNNLNLVMKTLAVVTIVISIPTLVASFFGMNFDEIPLDSEPWGFRLICGLSILIAIIGAIALVFFTKTRRK